MIHNSTDSEDRYRGSHTHFLLPLKTYLPVYINYFSHFFHELLLDGSVLRLHRTELGISHVIIGVPNLTYSQKVSQRKNLMLPAKPKGVSMSFSLNQKIWGQKI